jgi:hypothetical protein
MGRGNRSNSGAVIVIALAISLAVLARGPLFADASDHDKPRPAAEIGRYQSAGGDQNEVWLVDTTTGECWRAHTLGENRKWERLVPPLPVDPPEAKPDQLPNGAP